LADNLPPQLDDAPELDADEKAEVAEHCVRASKKFDQFDTDESGFLEGPELFEVASWVWGSFHPGGEPLSEELVAMEADKICRRVDENQDGRMSLDEFAAYFKRTAEAITKFRKKMAPKKAVAKRMAGNNNKISDKQEAEFGYQELDLMAELPVGLCDDAPELTTSEKQQVIGQSMRAEKKFRSMDADGSGKLGGAELLELGAWVWKSFNPGKDPSDEQISAESVKILKRIDANHDGELDFAEFSAYYEKTAASIARFHKKKAQVKKERKKKGSRSSSRASSRHSTPAQSPALTARSASKGNTPHGTPGLGPAAISSDHGPVNMHTQIPDAPLDEERPMHRAAHEEETCIGSRESINMLPTKEYLDLTVMTPLLEGLHLVSKQENPVDPLEFLAQYLIDNDPLRHEQTGGEAPPQVETDFHLPELHFDGRLFTL